jgi:hypothetical protein
LRESVLVLTHAEPHGVYGALQATRHVPDSHTGYPFTGVGHAFPHSPQLTVVLRGVSHPSFFLSSLQSPYPVLQMPAAQDPPTQARAMLLLEHTAPQAPQLSGLAAMLVSHPSLFATPCWLPLQSSHPLSHVPMHLGT